MNLKKVEQCKIQVSPSPMRAHSYACDVKLSCLTLQSYSESFAKKKTDEKQPSRTTFFEWDQWIDQMKQPLVIFLSLQSVNHVREK